MQIDDLIKLLNLFRENKTNNIPDQTSNNDFKDFIGKYVLIRAHRSGVNVGYFHRNETETITLTQTRKLWRWQAKEGIALESVAKKGIKEGTRATQTVDFISIRKDDICGIITVDDSDVIEEIKSYPVSEQNKWK